MATEQFVNNASTTLNGGITNVQTTLVVTSTSGFPATGNFRLLVESELMLVTGVSGTTFTVTRGIESTSNVLHNSGVTVTSILTSGALTALEADTKSVGPPGGRLTLTSNTPVMTADTTAVGTIFYDTFYTNLVPIGGTTYVITSDEVSLILDATNHLSGKIYDVFGIVSSSALKLVTGPAWGTSPSGTPAFGGSRGTGAGTTELQLSNGVWTNKNSLTHAFNNAVDFGPVSANQGTYLGSFYATANGQTGMAFTPASANGGSNPFLALYNGYNRKRYSSISRDSTAGPGWTESTAAPGRIADGNNNNRINYLDGLATETVEAKHSFVCTTTGGNVVYAGVVRNATSGTPKNPSGASNGVTGMPFTSENFGPLLGLSYLAAIIWVSGGTATIYGSNSVTNGQWLTASLEL